MIQLGSMRIHLINDCTLKVDPGGAFGLVPRALWASLLSPDENHRVPMVHLCLLVQTGGQNIVIDTGYGHKLPEKQRAHMAFARPNGDLIEGLARCGLRPEDVHLVINTHLHADHCSGNTRYADDGHTLLPTFPNAEHVVQRREYEDAMHPDERTRATYLPINYEPLYRNGQLRLLEGDAELAPGVYGHVTPGHTPGHMSVRLESEGQQLLFVCDLASYAIHFERLGWMTGYDVEPLRTLETKRRWQAWALKTDALLVFPHDSQRPVGRYRLNAAGKGVVQAVDETFV